MTQKIEMTRKTNETEVALALSMGLSGETKIDTGIGFFDHLLTLMAFHGGLNMKLQVRGDLEVDDHHSVEDVGIVLGQALQKLRGDGRDLRRYGFFILPMDEVLVRVVLDLSDRSHLSFQADFKRERIGTLSSENIAEFFQALVRASGMTLHLDMLKAGNDHHQAEALFKCFGRALQQALQVVSGTGVPSTKGQIAEKGS